MDDSALINQVEDIRRANNGLWIQLLRIALEHAPKQTKAVLKQINFNDSEISKLLKQVAGEG